MNDILGTAAPRRLAAATLTLAYDEHVIVPTLDFAPATGRVTAVVGANGCGKSTLLRGLAGLLAPAGGRVELDGADIRDIPRRRLARMVGILPQEPTAPDGILVAELVARGRHPHQGLFAGRDRADDAVIAEALRLTETGDLAGMRVSELSGGQRQRVWIAMAIAQNPDILLLDEPTTFLDVAHQLEVLDLLRALNSERGTTVVMVLHDLSLAARYADELVVMTAGRITAAGSPAAVLTEEVLAEAFGVAAHITTDPATGSPVVIPITPLRKDER